MSQSSLKIHNREFWIFRYWHLTIQSATLQQPKLSPDFTQRFFSAFDGFAEGSVDFPLVCPCQLLEYNMVLDGDIT
jgi:hypothetical protein